MIENPVQWNPVQWNKLNDSELFKYFVRPLDCKGKRRLSNWVLSYSDRSDEDTRNKNVSFFMNLFIFVYFLSAFFVKLFIHRPHSSNLIIDKILNMNAPHHRHHTCFRYRFQLKRLFYKYPACLMSILVYRQERQSWVQTLRCDQKQKSPNPV